MQYTSEMDNDLEYQDYRLEGVVAHDDGWSLEFNGGMVFWCPKNETGIVPKVGDWARFYGRGFGYTVRGLLIDGSVVFYRTEAEDMERHRQWVADNNTRRRAEFEATRHFLDADYAALPKPFQERLDRFRANNPDFRWEYEPYEMFTCKEAVKIADALGTTEAIEAFKDLSWDEQIQRVPDLDEGHSGNTFGAACALAYWYLQQPENVARIRGALSTPGG